MHRWNALKRSAMAIAMAATLDGASIDAQAESVDDLQAQIDRLNAEVTELARQQQAGASRPLTTSLPAGQAGSFKLPGSNTSVTLGGYVKLDAVFSNPSAGVDAKGDLSWTRPRSRSDRTPPTTSAIRSSSAPGNRACS